jgi:hypothetical protein
MAAVAVRTGITSATPLAEVPLEYRDLVMDMRRQFCERELPRDCRLLLEFVKDGRASGFAGYPDEDSYLREGLGLDPGLVGWACDGLKRLDRTVKQPLGYAVEVGKLGKHGVNQHSAGGDNVTSSGRGNSPTYAVRRLMRDNPDLAERVGRGELTAHAAAVQAGFRRRAVSVPLDPRRAAAALCRHFGAEDRRLIARLIEAKE